AQDVPWQRTGCVRCAGVWVKRKGANHMRTAIVVLAAIALPILLVAGSCAAWGYTSTSPGADFAGAFFSFFMGIIGLTLAVIAGFFVVGDARRQQRGRWHTSALIVTLSCGLLPPVLFVLSAAITIAEDSPRSTSDSLLFTVANAAFAISFVSM